MALLRYDRALYRPLGAQTQPAMRAHDLAMLHTMVGTLSSTERYFKVANGSGYTGTESHWGLGGPWGGDGALGLDGDLYQWQDGRYTADAAYQGNPRALTLETADNSPRYAEDLAAWSPAQVDAIVDWLVWVTDKATHADCPDGWECKASGIPRVLVPDSKPGRRGIAYHRQGCDPWRVSGGERWSTSTGKVCPGGKRIAQIEQIVDRVRGAEPRKPKPPVVDLQTGKREPLRLGVIRRGMTGPKVVLWQRAAGSPTDGIFGPGTEADVKALQRKIDVPADGLAGPGTLRAYLAYRGTLEEGDANTAVRFVQAVGRVATDGHFRANTKTAVQQMQRWAGLEADGIVGPNTRKAIIR